VPGSLDGGLWVHQRLITPPAFLLQPQLDKLLVSTLVVTNRTETSPLFCPSISDSVSEAPGSWSLAKRPAQAAAEGGVMTGLSLPRMMRANSHLCPPGFDPDPTILADPIE